MGASETGFTIAKLSDTLFVFGSFFLMILFACRRGQLFRFLHVITHAETSASVRRSSIVSVIVLSCMFLLQETVILVQFAESASSWSFGIKSALIAAPAQANNYLVIYPLYYILMIRILSEHEVKLLQQASDVIQDDGGCSKRSLTYASSLLYQCIAARHTFERLFNIIPFSVFGVLFFMIPSSIADVSITRRAQQMKSLADFQVMMYGTFHFAVLLLIVTLIHSVCRTKQQTQAAAQQLIHTITQANLTHSLTAGQQSLINDANAYRDMPFTGLFLFNVDTSLVLTFASSLITFTVLLCQLTIRT